MESREPFCRQAGAGPGVVCIHSNASSSSQWRALMDRLAATFLVLAADSHGAGNGPPWPTGRTLSLRDEVALLEPVFARAGSPFTLVGHSYGAAVALIAALQRPERIRALLLYEPALFALVEAESPPPNDAQGIRDTVAAAAAARRLIKQGVGPGGAAVDGRVSEPAAHRVRRFGAQGPDHAPRGGQRRDRDVLARC